VIEEDFIDRFNKLVDIYKQIIHEEDRFLFCQNLIGKRNFEILYIMLENFYKD